MSLVQEAYTGLVEALDSQNPWLQRCKDSLAKSMDEANHGWLAEV